MRRHLASAGLAQYEISNFARPRLESQHNLRYWQRRPYLGLGLDASSMLREAGDAGYVLRSKTSDDLKGFLDQNEAPETAWLSPERQLEEAWFVGLRLNAGVEVASLRNEFGAAPVNSALAVVHRLVEDGLLTFDGTTVRLTPRGRLMSNDVFQEFLTLAADEQETTRSQ